MKVLITSHHIVIFSSCNRTATTQCTIVCPLHAGFRINFTVNENWTSSIHRMRPSVILVIIPLQNQAVVTYHALATSEHAGIDAKHVGKRNQKFAGHRIRQHQNAWNTACTFKNFAYRLMSLTPFTLYRSGRSSRPRSIECASSFFKFAYQVPYSFDSTRPFA